MLGGNQGSLLYGDISVLTRDLGFEDKNLVLFIPVPGHFSHFTFTVYR